MYSYVNTRKLWYSWFNSAPIGWFLIIFANVPSISNILLPEDFFGKIETAGWLATLITIGILYFFRRWLLPVSVLLIRNNGTFIKKHGAELSLAIALVSIIVTIIGWFVAK